MYLLIVYDIKVERVNKVKSFLRQHLFWVQNSVFECIMDAAKCREVKEILINIIKDDEDSIRFYYLGNNYKTKVEHFGIKKGFDMEGALIF